MIAYLYLYLYLPLLLCLYFVYICVSFCPEISLAPRVESVYLYLESMVESTPRHTTQAELTAAALEKN